MVGRSIETQPTSKLKKYKKTNILTNKDSLSLQDNKKPTEKGKKKEYKKSIKWTTILQ